MFCIIHWIMLGICVDDLLPPHVDVFSTWSILASMSSGENLCISLMALETALGSSAGASD